MKENAFPKLKGKMAEKGYTTVALAKELNICPATAYRKMRRQVEFTLPEIAKTLKLLGCKFEDVFTEEEC